MANPDKPLKREIPCLPELYSWLRTIQIQKKSAVATRAAKKRTQNVRGFLAATRSSRVTTGKNVISGIYGFARILKAQYG